jgi:hypothetical protein
MAFELTEPIERHLAAALIAQMGQTSQWYDDDYRQALRVTPEHAWSM